MMYKVSHYIAENEFFDSHADCNKTVVFSTQTSKLICMDSHSWQQIKRGNIDTIDQLTQQSLKNYKIIVDQDLDELDQLLQENQNAINKNTVLHYAFQPSANCSLGCGYCGQKHSNKQLADELHEATLQRIEAKIKQNPQIKTLAISWFGAEPIQGIQKIRKLTPRLIALAEQYQLKYRSAMVTNGLSLSDYIANELIYTHKVTNFEITLDGSEEYHDKRRHLKTGGATFKQIYQNLLHLIRQYGDQASVSLRSNVDDRNREGIVPLIDQLKADNILDKCSIYFAPIHSWGNDADQLVSSKLKWAEQEIDWFIYLKELGINSDLLYKRRKITCMAVSELDELIDPFGNVFNCTEVSLVPTYEKAGKNRHQIAHVSQADPTAEEGREYFKKFSTRHELEQYPCHRCNIFPVCGGACPKEWMEGRSPCPSIKYNIKERMMLSYLWRR